MAHLLPQNSVSGQLVAVERVRQPVALAEVVGVRGLVLDDEVAGRCMDQEVQVAAPLAVADAQDGVVLVPMYLAAVPGSQGTGRVALVHVAVAHQAQHVVVVRVGLLGLAQAQIGLTDTVAQVRDGQVVAVRLLPYAVVVFLLGLQVPEKGVVNDSHQSLLVGGFPAQGRGGL